MKSEIFVKFKVKTPEHRIAVDTLIKAHSILEKELGVQSHLVLFNKTKNVNKTLRGVYFNDLKCITMNLFACRTIEDCVYVLSHEFRHALQFKNKWISKDSTNECGKWKGKKYNCDYLDLPWEKDARKWGEKYSKGVIDSLNLHKKSKIRI